MEMFLLYLYTILDRVNLVVGLASIALLIYNIIVSIAACDPYVRGDHKKECIRASKQSFVLFVCFTVAYIALPSKKDSLVLGAGYAIISLAKSDKASSLSSKAMEYIEQELTNAITSTKKEAK